MKITLKNIMHYEQLTGKSFNEFSMEADDLLALLYVIEEPDINYKSFKETLFSSKKLFIRKAKEINRYLERASQFYEKKETNENTSDEGKKQKISDLAVFLIYSGLDANFVMNEMEVQDIPIFYKGAIDKVKVKLENDRRWTYLGMLPHLTKPITEQQLITFSWEEDAIKENSNKDIERDEERFNEFMKQGKDFIEYGKA